MITKRFELHVNGRLQGRYRSLKKAEEHIPSSYDSYSIGERIAGRLFNRSFGYVPGKVTGAEMARQGVPLHSAYVNDQPL